LTKPANILGNLLHQLDYIGFVFWHRSITVEPSKWPRISNVDRGRHHSHVGCCRT
jgi:hypothetical protein